MTRDVVIVGGGIAGLAAAWRLRHRDVLLLEAGGPTGWGINFRVRDLDAIVSQLRVAGVEVAIDPEAYPNGRFAQLRDPEGNAIQLWQQA